MGKREKNPKAVGAHARMAEPGDIPGLRPDGNRFFIRILYGYAEDESCAGGNSSRGQQAAGRVYGYYRRLSCG